MENVLLSIIIPVYNNEKTIKSCVESCISNSLISQGNIEIIIIDDFSTDNTSAICRSLLKTVPSNYELLYHRLNANSGPAVARNEGLKMSKGDYIAFLDSDDEAIDSRYVKQLTYLETHSNIALVISALAEYTEDDVFIRNRVRAFSEQGESLGKKILLGEVSSFMPTIMMQREVYAEIGGFNDRLRIFEDKEFLLRVCKRFEIFYEPAPLVKRRITASDLPKVIDVEGYVAAWNFCYEKAVHLFPSLSKVRTEYFSRNYFVIGRLYQRIGKPSKALKFYWKSKTRKSLLGIMSVILLPKELQQRIATKIWRRR